MQGQIQYSTRNKHQLLQNIGVGVLRRILVAQIYHEINVCLL